MALEQSDISWLRRKVGSQPDDATLEQMYAELGSREEVAAQIIETRLADVTTRPSTLTIPDDISVSYQGQAGVLRRQLDDLHGTPEAVIVRPTRRSRR